MDDLAGVVGIAADADRHLAEPEGVEHIELAGAEGEGRGRRQLDRHHIGAFLARPSNRERPRDKAICF